MAIPAPLQRQLTPLRVQMAIGMATKGFAALASFVLSWLIARSFGAEGVGIFALAQTTATIAATLAVLGLDYVVVREIAQALKLGVSADARRILASATKLVAMTSLVLGGGLLVLRHPFAAQVLKEPAVAAALGIMALYVPILALTRIASSALRATGQVTTSQTINGPIGTGLCAVTLAICMAAGAARDPLLPVALYCGFGGLAAVIGWRALRRTANTWSHDPASEHPPMLAMGLPLLAVTLSQLFIDWFAMVVLTATGSAADAGQFRIAFQIVSVLSLLMVASDAILAPHVAANYAVGAKSRIAVTLSRTTAMLLALAAPLLLTCLLAPAWLLSWFGPQFVAAAVPLQIIALGQVVAFALGPIGSVITMTRHEKWALGYGITGAAVAALLCLWLIPLYGVTGAAVALTSAIVLRRVCAALIVRFVIGIELWRWRVPDKGEAE